MQDIHGAPSFTHQLGPTHVAVTALDYGRDPWYMLHPNNPLYPPTIRKQAATILGQLDPLYRDDAIFARLARVLDEDDDAAVRDAAYGALMRLAAAPERSVGV